MKKLLLALILAAAPSCVGNAPSPAVASIVVRDSFVKHDGQVFIARWDASAEAILYWKGTGLPLYPPVILEQGKTIVVNHTLDIRLELENTDPIPAWCAALFRVGEAEALGVTFTPAQP